MNLIYSYVKQIYQYVWPAAVYNTLDLIICKINLLHTIFQNYFTIYPTELVALIIKVYNPRELYCFLTELIQSKQSIRVFMGHNKIITTSSDIRSYGIGLQHTIAVRSNFELYASGFNQYGQLGLGDFYNVMGIAKRVPIEPIRFIVCKNYTTFAISLRETLYAWGLGFSFRPELIGLCQVLAISCSTQHIVALTRTEIYVWGNNSYGQLGLSDCISRTKPTKLFLPGIVSASCADRFTLFLDQFGQLYISGFGGVFGINQVHCVPNLIKNISSVLFLDCSDLNLIVLDRLGKVFVAGQLDVDVNEPVQIQIDRVISVCCDRDKFVAVCVDQSAYMWDLMINANARQIKIDFLTPNHTQYI